MTEKKDIPIPNWSMFGAKTISIEVLKQSIDNVIVYNPMVTFFLDNGSEKDEEQVVAIFTDIYEEDPEDALKICAFGMGMMFESISNRAFIITLDGEVEREVDLTQLLNTEEHNVPKTLH